MAQSYFPFDSGAGANVTEAQWSKMAQNWLSTGIIKSYNNELSVYADSTGMQAKIKTGAAWIKGHYFEADAEEVLAIGTADGTNPRIDRIIVRLDWSLNTIQLAVLQGTPAVSPTAPALTQNTSRWEISLSQVYVGANVSTITPGNITDERYFVGNANTQSENWINAVYQNSWTTNDGTPLGYFKDNFGLVHIRGSITGGSTANGTVIFTLPLGYRPQYKQHFVIPAYTNTTWGTCEILVNTDGTVALQSGSGVWYPHLYLPPFRAYQ